MGGQNMHAKKRPREKAIVRDGTSEADPRFAAAEWDPRFSRVPKKAKNAVADDRFKNQLKTNPGFRESHTPVDRFGRPKSGGKLDKSLHEIVTDDSSESDDEVGDKSMPAPHAAYADDSDDSDSELEDFVEGEEEVEAIPRGKATNRLAVVGLDWSTTRAVDIYASLDSFCPAGKRVVSVEIHPSKFGLERLAQEAKFGPQVVSMSDLKVVQEARKHGASEKRNGPGDHDDIPSEIDSVGSDIESSGDDNLEEKRWKEQAALRKYEEERLMYYYAVAEFEDIKSADAVYEQCDGVEYAQSGRAFDLRFVPDDMVIETKPRERADRLPDGYVPPNVTPSSLNNSTVKLSWDADDPDRVILKKKAVGKHELDEENLKAYLAVSSEDEEEKPSQADVEKKRNLLLGPAENEVYEEPEMDMEVSFEPGMLEKGEEIVKRKQSREEQKHETPWEARLRRQQERKTERRRKRKEAREAGDTNDASVLENDSHGDDDKTAVLDDGFSDPFFSVERGVGEHGDAGSRKKTKGKNQGNFNTETGTGLDDGDERRKKAELALLLMDSGPKHAGEGRSMREMLAAVESDDEDDRARRKREKRSRGKRRSQKERAENGTAAKPSVMDTDDPRFQGVFESHLFAMDPTHPKFKDNETTQRILKEKMRRTKKRVTEEKAFDAKNAGTEGNDASKAMKRSKGGSEASNANSELRQLAARVKARASFSGKRKGKR